MARSSAWRNVGRLFVLGVFVVYVVELSPHLVHHLFDHDDAQVDCPFATAADRQHPAAVPVVALATAVSMVVPVAAHAEPQPIEPCHVSIDARAPPLSA
jgi:hypothetical protein